MAVMAVMAVMVRKVCAARPVGARRGGELLGPMDVNETRSRIRDGITAAIVLREQAVRNG